MSHKQNAKTIERIAPSRDNPINIFPKPRTELARLALKARAEYIATGAPLLDIDSINAEVADRRGEHQSE